VACSTVPHIAIVAGDSIGPANFVMGGRSQSPRFMYAWPGARVLQAAAEEEEEVAAAAAAVTRRRARRAVAAAVRKQRKAARKQWQQSVSLFRTPTGTMAATPAPPLV
jgi:acetyl-CoA carboxylase carboxyltransferase component